jgi:hypothetical protein
VSALERIGGALIARRFAEGFLFALMHRQPR